MFGYIKPYVPSLTVAQHEAYKATYCGLCREMGKITGQFSRMFLSFDCTFLAVFRAAIEKTPSEFEKKGCIAHPFTPKTYMRENSALSYSAKAAAILVSGKIKDDKADEKGAKKLLSALLSPTVDTFVKKAGKEFKELNLKVTEYLEKLSQIEKSKEKSIDTPADCFGQLLGCVSSFGLSGNNEAIAKAVGYSVGKIIYVLDASDDIFDDIKNEKYNPLALVYGKDIIESKEKPHIGKNIGDSLYTAVCLESSRLLHTLDLADLSSSDILSGIIYNIADSGIKSSARHVLYGTKESEDPFRHQY